VTTRKEIVEAYFEGFRNRDHDAILSLLTEDVVWDLPGYRSLSGRDAFDGEIENEQFEGSPELTVDRLVEEGDAIVAIGSGEARFKSGARNRFVFCDVFTFTDDTIRRVESYLVPMND
jgi:ketosteroid isomerase-like protein